MHYNGGWCAGPERNHVGLLGHVKLLCEIKKIAKMKNYITFQKEIYVSRKLKNLFKAQSLMWLKEIPKAMHQIHSLLLVKYDFTISISLLTSRKVY